MHNQEGQSHCQIEHCHHMKQGKTIIKQSSEKPTKISLKCSHYNNIIFKPGETLCSDHVFKCLLVRYANFFSTLHSPKGKYIPGLLLRKFSLKSQVNQEI